MVRRRGPTLSVSTRRGRWCPVVVGLALLAAAPAAAAASTGCGTHHPAGETQVEAEVVASHATWRAAMPGRSDCPVCHQERCVAAPSCGATLVGARGVAYAADPTLPLTRNLPRRDTLLPPGLPTQPPTPPPQASA